jgi:gamma-glutamyltranspeptidase/glutathione hydrolase
MSNRKCQTGNEKLANDRRCSASSFAGFPFLIFHFRFGILCIIALCVLSPAFARAATGTHGMIAADHRLASQAGLEILQAGGNAVDAAVATAFALGVVNPSSCGIGGGGFMLIYLGQSERAVALDYRETAPAAARRDMFIHNGQAVPALSLRGGLAVAVPGEVAGLTEALRRYGTLPLSAVMQPAIRYAGGGFAAERHLAEEIAANAAALHTDPLLARTFLHPDGSPLRAGETVREPELAATLQRVADGGPYAFYHGAVAEGIARSVHTAGGVLSEGDLAAYHPQWRLPLWGRHGDAQVITMPPPSSGGGALLEILGILRHDDLSRLGQNSPKYAHLVAEAMQHAFADRAEFYGDPDFVHVPLAELLAPANAAVLRRRISATRTLDPGAYGSRIGGRRAAAADAGTSHFSVMDAAGNAVACTTTINTAFGSMVVAGETGIILNNEMDDFSAQPGVPNVYGLIGNDANAIAPGKRPLSSMTPTIVTRGGQAVLALGGSGGPLIISATTEVLLGVLEFDLDAAAAVAAPRFHDQWRPAVLALEPEIWDTARQALARYGYVVKEITGMGAVQAVKRSAGVFEGASDPRKGGEASGW